MIDFTYNPIIPADYKSHGKRTSLRSLSLRGTFSIVAACGGFRRWKTPQVGTTKS